MSIPFEQEPAAGWDELQPKAEATEDRAWGPRLIIAGLALLAAAIFIVQNSERVETRFLFLSGDFRLFWVIIISMLLGAALGQVVPMVRRRRKAKRAKRDEKKPPTTS